MVRFLIDRREKVIFQCFPIDLPWHSSVPSDMNGCVAEFRKTYMRKINKNFQYNLVLCSKLNCILVSKLK